jgi:hypothetical protein
MARVPWCSVLATATILVVALSAGRGALSSDAPQPTQATVRDRGAGGVTVTATWLGVQEDRLAVRLALDTHSVDLSGFDVLANTVLRDGSGQEWRAVRWQEERASSQHRTGVVFFPFPKSLGPWLAVVVRNLAGVEERVLVFDFRRQNRSCPWLGGWPALGVRA